jgi:23S rRNA (pseudouridine1915-N3)-methyltransferase
MIIPSVCRFISNWILFRYQNVKNLTESQQRKEGELILAKITPTDQLILLDENGKISSVGFSKLQRK